MVDWLEELDRLDREPGGAIPFFTLLRNHARELIDAAKERDGLKHQINTHWRPTVKKYIEIGEKTNKIIDNLKALLRRVEWEGVDEGATVCPICKGIGHGWDVMRFQKTDCELAKALNQKKD